MKNKFKQLLLASILVLALTGCTKTLPEIEKNSGDNKNASGQVLTENILCRPTDEETIEIYKKHKIDLSKLPYCYCEKEELTEEEEAKYQLPVEEETKTDETTEKEETKQADKKDTKTTTKSEEKKEETEEVVTETEVKKYKCKEFKATSGGWEGIWASIFVKPLAWVILFCGKYTSNFGIGLIITTILIRLIMYPLTKKTAAQSEMMKKIQPELDRLEKKYANKDQNDREVMMAKSQEMMAIYKKHNFNPMTGCLTSFLQLPIFIAFLEAINRVPAIFEEKLLGMHLGTSPSVGIGNGNWLYVIIVILVGVTTYLSFAKASATGNEQSQRQTKMMMNGFAIMITVMSIFMTTALGIYWTISNLFTLAQNYLVKRRMQNVK